MRVLFLTHTVPFPPVSGERVRNWSLARALHDRGWSTALFSLGTDHEAASPPAELERSYDDVLIAGQHAGAARRARTLAAVVRRRALHESAYVDRSAVARLRAWPPLGAARLIVASLHMFPYVPPRLRGRTVLDPHNAEGRRLATMAGALGRSPRGLAARLQVGPVTRYERDAVRSVARTLAVSPQEAAVFESYAPGRVDLVPNGVEPDEALFRADPPATRAILFVGSLDYSANLDAVRHLTRTVAGHLTTPGVTLVVAGSNPGRAAAALARRSPVEVELLGHVRSLDESFRRARAFAVPLRFGGGTRLKILEALARGVPVVTTSLGCEGLGLESGRDLLVADDPAEFARSLDLLLADDELCRRLAANGFETVRRRYSWTAIGAAFGDALVRAAESVSG